MNTTILKSRFFVLSLSLLVAGHALADDKKEEKKFKGEVGVSFIGTSVKDNDGKTTGDHGGGVSANVVYSDQQDMIGNYEANISGDYQAFGDENVKTGGLRVGFKIIRDQKDGNYYFAADPNAHYELGGEVFNESSLLTTSAGLRVVGIRKKGDNTVTATVTPVGYDHDRLRGTSGAYMGLGGGYSRNVEGLFDVKAMLDAGFIFSGGRDLIIETEYISDTERVQRIVQTGMRQDGPGKKGKVRIGASRKIGNSAVVEVYVEGEKRDANYVETGFEGMTLNKTSANSDRIDTGIEMKAIW